MPVGTRKIVVWGGILALFVAGCLVVREFSAETRPQPADKPAKVGSYTSTRTGAEQPAKPPRPVTPKNVPLPPLMNPHIIIEKSAHRLTVRDGDRPVKAYRAAIGAGRGDKVREGDRCTPEGDFYICVKNAQSRFTLSLGLSYPNIKDARRGLRDGLITKAQHAEIVLAIRQRRQPPWNTTLGGEIMIHGCGAGRDWTLGCVALDDADIEELFAAMPLGTPVSIRP